MQRTSGGLNHFGVVVIVGAQTDRHLETDRPPIDLKRDGNRPTARGCLDACYLDLEFAHRFTRAGVDRNRVTRFACRRR